MSLYELPEFDIFSSYNHSQSTCLYNILSNIVGFIKEQCHNHLQPINMHFLLQTTLKIYLQVLKKLENKIKTVCKPALTSTTACVNVAPFQYSIYLSAKMPQSYLDAHNVWIIIHMHQSSNHFNYNFIGTKTVNWNKIYPFFCCTRSGCTWTNFDTSIST